jgi:hypothetical protein
MDPKALRVNPQHALAVYAESLAAGATVALFGDASLGLGDRLVGLGASSVHVWDPESHRARIEADRAPAGVIVRAYETPGTRPRNMDLAIVPDLGLFKDAPLLLSRVRELVGDDGVLLVGARNRDASGSEQARAFEYYELFDLVAGHFRAVTMVAELPFHGVALVTLGEDGDSSGVSVDTQLAGEARVADRFVVLASQRDVTPQPYTVVELPSAPDERASAEFGAALRSQAARTEQVEALLRDRDREVAALALQVEHFRAEALAAGASVAGLQEAARRAEGSEVRAVTVERELAQLTEANASESRRFEDILQERARTARSLEADLARRDQMVRELVDTLEERVEAPAPQVPAAPVNDDLSEENGRLRELLDALALDVARREAEARAAAWTVSELEHRLERATSPAEPPGASPTHNSR